MLHSTMHTTMHTMLRTKLPKQTTSTQWLALMVVLALSPTLHAAEVYRWLDANGQVHFSSIAPRGVDYERVDLGAQRGPGTLANPQSTEDREQVAARASGGEAGRGGEAPSNDELGLTDPQRELRAQLQQEADSRRARLEEERHDQCARARRQYEQLTTHSRVRVVDDSGSETLLSDAELQTRIAAARDGIVTNCD